MSWFVLEGVFDGITEQKTLQTGTELATFKVTEEARGTQEASTFSVTSFAQVAQTAKSITVGTPVAVKCRVKSRNYQDKNGQDRISTELNGYAIYVGSKSAQAPAKPAQDFAQIPF